MVSTPSLCPSKPAFLFKCRYRDIRAGIALLIAAMSANGTSLISNIEQIDRGYENIEERLNALGAKIERL